MIERGDPSALHWLIGAELSRYRRDSGLSLTDLSRETGIKKPKLNHMETGRYRQFPDDIAAVLAACRVGQADIDRLTALSGRVDRRTWWAPWEQVLPDWFKTFVGLEGLAAAEFSYEPVVIPGLLQTEDYARELTLASGFIRRDQGDRFVGLRRARALLLTAEEPLTLHAVITEAALRLRVGSSALINEQLAHLAAMAELPNVTVQVLRPQDGPHAAAGNFMVLDFEHALSIAYVELLGGAVYVQDQGDVATYRMVADNLRQVALPPAESLSLIRGLMDKA